jgi:hypothetical protein
MIAFVSALALAGVFVNGEQVDPGKLPQARLPQAEVMFDSSGNVFIMAPGFQIPPDALWSATPVPAAASPSAPPMQDNGVPRARYWLATEDGGSSGHAIDISINGVDVVTIRSGDAVKIMDLAPHLRLGDNDVVIRSTSAGAAGSALYVYMGTGSDQSGTVVMDAPTIQFGVGKSRAGVYERQYVLPVAL